MRNLSSARLNSEMFQVSCFLAKNLPLHLSSVGFIPRRIGFPRFFQPKSQPVDLQKKTSSEIPICVYINFKIRGDFDKHQKLGTFGRKKTTVFFGGELKSTLPMFLFGASGHLQKQQVRDDNVIITHYYPPKKRHACFRIQNLRGQTCDELSKISTEIYMCIYIGNLM